MKRVASILLIALLLFNWYGYRFVFNYLQDKADSELNAKIDANDYDESQLVEIRVPIDIPYQYTSTDFERSYGEIEHDGQIYTYIKRKVENGFLILKCIPNIQKEKIKDAKHLMVKINNGIEQDQNGKTSSPLAKIFKNLSNDYNQNNLDFSFSGFIEQNRRNTILNSSFINRGFLISVEQPPDLSLI